MHDTHQELAGGEPAAADLIAIAGTRRASTAAAWVERSAEQIRHLLTECAALQEEVTYWRRWAASTAGLEPGETPPAAYVEALRTAQREPYRSIVVEIDGQDWSVGLSSHAEAAPDPLRELSCWQMLVTAVREARAGAVTA
ncbi:hypothetical protein AB0I81_22375 [Nonomuraea sp. NPDC050404]|uniref:hypothetical protein n=1 Tax=Nonomuraea sp. NPDC050404 TaxID=3155783 RepID=UPI0033F5F72D